MATARVLQEIRVRRALLKRRPRRRRLPRQLPPNAVILAYRAELLLLVRDAQRLVRERLLPLLPSILEEARRERGDSLRLDASGRRVRDAMAEVVREFGLRHAGDELEQLARRMGERTSRYQREQLARQVRAAVGVDVLQAEPTLAPHLDNFVQQNVALIRTLPSTLFDQVEARVQSGVTLGLRHEDLAEEIEGRFEVSESRAELIARDQTLKFYGSLNELRQKALGIGRYVWRTAQDERVRPEHAEREGRIYEWADDSLEIPGEAVNCRCFGEPLVDELLESL